MGVGGLWLSIVYRIPSFLEWYQDEKEQHLGLSTAERRPCPLEEDFLADDQTPL